MQHHIANMLARALTAAMFRLAGVIPMPTEMSCAYSSLLRYSGVAPYTLQRYY